MSSHHPSKLYLFVVAAALAAGCSSQAAPQPGAQPGGGGRGRGGGGAGGAVPVTTAKVEAKDIPLTIPAVGTMEAIQTVQVRAQVTGQLSELHFAEGEEVRKGQLLFALDPRPFEASLQQAQAVLSRDTATANNAKSQMSRYEDLYKRGLIPRDQYESQTATSQSAQATLEADRAAVETARLNLQYTKITAPISGRTGSLNVHLGDLVRANDTTPMVVINQIAPIYCTFSVPGRYLQDIRRYQAAKPLTVEAQGQASVPPGAQPKAPPIFGSGATGAQGQNPEAPPADNTAVAAGPQATGTVTFIDNAVDPTTGTIKMKATFANADRTLWPGLFVQVRLDLTTDKNAIVIPAIAVQSSQEGQFVYVVANHVAEQRNVVVARQQGEQMVIASGLKAGEQVVTDGQLRLTPGATVILPGEPGGMINGNGGNGSRGGRRGAAGQGGSNSDRSGR